MASESEAFRLIGPTHLTAVDWRNLSHRRSVAASLVQGVYTLEHDRRKNREGTHALAPPWWEFFGFKLIRRLVDVHDSSYFGAIFEFTLSYPPHQNYPGQRPPRYVMAFRGTINKSHSRVQDLKANILIAMNNLHKSKRFQQGMESTSNIISMVGAQNIWLAGHSLGSAVALLIGRRMAKSSDKHLIETYLFNSPFITAPFHHLMKSETIRLGLKFTNTFVTAAVFSGAQNQRSKGNDPFAGLYTWVPYLFVNPGDPICCEYSGYFKRREKMVGIGKLVAKHSITSLVSGYARGVEVEAVHLIPSAYLTTNISGRWKLWTDILSFRKFREAHAIEQWWSPDLKLKEKHCRYH